MVLRCEIRVRIFRWVMAAAVAMSCTATDVVEPISPSDSAAVVTFQPNGVPRTLRLGGGEHLRYPIKALDPTTHTFEVRLVVEPPARIRLWFRTWYGVRLELVRSSTTDDGCVARTDRIVCVQEFAILGAQHPGRWTLHARNRSKTSTSAEITITFTPLH